MIYRTKNNSLEFILFFYSGFSMSAESLLLKDHASVDSAVSSATVVPLGSSSVQSSSGSSFDTLQGAMDRFLKHQPRIAWKEAHIKRAIVNLIRKNSESEMNELFTQWNRSRKNTTTSSSSLLHPHLAVSGQQRKLGVPPANLLRPPRGNLIASTKDLLRELLSIRRLPRSERSGVAVRLIRTLDPACPTHCDIAFALFVISTL